MYPEPGSPLLPDALRPLLGCIRVPRSLLRRFELPDALTLGHLNDRVWSVVPPQAVTPLASEVVKAVRAADRRDLASLENPIFNRTVALDELADLKLSARARNALIRGGLVVDGAIDAPITVGDLLRETSGVGALTLLDLLTVAHRVNEVGPDPSEALRAPGMKQPGVGTLRPSRAVGRAADLLERRRWRNRIGRSDPRLGERLVRLHPRASNAREAGELLRITPFEPAAARRKVREIKEFVAEADALRRRSLPEELDELVTAMTAGRDNAKRVVLARLGLAGEPPVTLARAGEIARLTRERARQIEHAFLKVVGQPNPAWTPALDRALRALRDELPLSESQAQRVLAAEGIAPTSFSAESLARAAQLFGKGDVITYDPATGILSPPGFENLATDVTREARRLANQWGVTTADEVSVALDEAGEQTSDRMVRMLLPQVPGFAWLNEDGGWFWLKGRRNKLLGQIEKIMSVAGSIDLGELRNGVGRHHRMRGFRPPRHVLAQLCLESGLYSLEETRVVGGSELPDWRVLLGGIERTLVEILFDNGYVMRRTELEEIAVGQRGVNRSSFYVYLDYSPLLERYARGVYGLRGAPVTAAHVEALIPVRTRTEVLKDQGWTADRRIWIGYRVSPATLNSGVLSTPSAVREMLQGEFVLDAEDGRPVGTLVVDKDRMWGVGPFFRRWGVEAGDYIVVTLDTTGRRATLETGDEELLVRYQAA